MAPLTTQSILPNTLRIRGSKRPRKNSSSTTGARKLTNTSSANQPQEPLKKVSRRS